MLGVGQIAYYATCVAWAAVFYQVYLKEFFATTLGFGRVVQGIDEFPYTCRRIEHPRLEACEDIWLDNEARTLYAACAGTEGRLAWNQAVGRLNVTGRRPGGSELIALDIDQPGHDGLFNMRAIKPVGYTGATGDGTLDLLGFDAQILDGDTIQFYFINQRPPVGPFNNVIDASKSGANSTIDVFEMKRGDDQMRHLRTIWSPDHVQTPNRVAALRDGAFLVTNDHSVRSGWRMALDIIIGGGNVAYCDSNGECHDAFSGDEKIENLTPSAPHNEPKSNTWMHTYLAKFEHLMPRLKLKFPNGLARGFDGLFYLPSSVDGQVRVLALKDDNTLQQIDTIRVGMVGTTIMSIGAIIQIASYGVPEMIVGRIVAGIGNGINTSTAPVWQGETSKASWRGKLIVIEMIMNIAGFSLSNWVTYGFSFVGGSAAWRVPLAFQFLFIIILFLTVPWLPESPRWLMAKGRIDEAEIILADLEAMEVDSPFIIAQSKDIQWAVQYEKDHAVRWRDLLRGRTGDQAGTHTIRRMLLGMGTQAMQQLSGINVTSYYLPTVLIESVGLSNNLARLLAACNSVSYLLFSLIGIPNVERWGRRKMMMYAAAGQFFCYTIITICIRYNELDSLAIETRRKWAESSIAFFFLYYVFFGIGWQGVPWLYPTEINSMAMRTKGAAVGTATNWIFNFMVVEITPPGIRSLHWQFYIIWTVFNFSFIPIVYFLYPETAGRSLEDIDRLYAGPTPLLIFRDKEAIASKRPQRFIDLEDEEVRRHSSVVPAHVHAANRAVANKSESEKGNSAELNQYNESV